MFNSKKLKIIACSLFLFLIIILPIGNVYAEDSDPLIDTFKTLLLISPATWPLQTAFKLSELVSFDPIGQITSPVNFVAGGIIKGAADLIFLIGSTIMDLGQGILTSVIGSPSTWLNPTNNPLVTKGWGIVRNVANAVLVIGLVIIAINIILGREENKAKKTLINFIIVALLINFTPVLCGFVIDGANILTKSFVSGGINGNMSAKIIENFSLGFKETGNDAVNAFLVSLVFLIFAFISTFIYVLYSLLFLGRSIILWLLVIFSPIAFATKVFPQSKYVRKIFPSVLYWDDWVESFFQWCVIGIPAGMSIYLANMLIPAINFTIDTTSTDAIMGSMVNSAFQCLTPFIILIAGFFISISSGGQVGSYVGGVATGAWAMTGGKTLGRLSEKAREGGEWMVEGTKRTATGAIIGGASGLLQGYNDSGLIKGSLSGNGALVGGLTGVTMGALDPKKREESTQKWAKFKENIGWNRRGDNAGNLNKDVKDSGKRTSNLPKEEREKISLSPSMTRAGEIERAGILKKALEKGELTDKQLEYLTNNGEWAKTFGINLKDVAKNRPDLAPNLIDAIPGKTDTPISMIKNIVEEMNDKKAGTTINSQSYLNVDVMCSVGATNPRILDGKLKSGNGKDMENVKQGFVNVIKELVPGIGGNINTNNLQEFVDDDMNNQAIGDTIETLEKSSNKDDNIKAQGLKNLANYALAGKFNPPESNIKKTP